MIGYEDIIQQIVTNFHNDVQNSDYNTNSFTTL